MDEAQWKRDVYRKDWELNKAKRDKRNLDLDMVRQENLILRKRHEETARLLADKNSYSPSLPELTPKSEPMKFEL